MSNKFKTSAFSRRHYELFAKLSAKMVKEIETGPDSPGCVILNNLYEVFKADNSGFDSARFDKAYLNEIRRLDELERDADNVDELPQDEWEAITDEL
jgi:hypothetical protein